MAYSNWPNTTFYSSFTSSQYDAYPSQMLTFDQVDTSAPETSTNGWSACEQQCDGVDRWQTSIYISPASTSYEPQAHGYDQWVYPENYWPTTEQYAQSDYTTLNYGAFASTATLEASGVAPTPSNNNPFLPMGGYVVGGQT